MMKYLPFDRSKHLYSNEAFAEFIKDAIRYFAGTPVQPLPPSERFLGTGIYAIYYTDSHKEYAQFSQLNRLSHALPIYVGKAVPKGWRQSRVRDSETENNRTELFTRLSQHTRSIQAVEGLLIKDFSCRFMIFDGSASDMIGTVEAALIKLHLPLWNTVIDGFGNHDPGKGRYNQAKSDWDVLHPGRSWADKCQGQHNDRGAILLNIANYFQGFNA